MDFAHGGKSKERNLNFQKQVQVCVLRIRIGSSSQVPRAMLLHLPWLLQKKREFIVDSRASLHMMSKSSLTREEQETIRKLKGASLLWLQMELLIRLEKQQCLSVIWTCLFKFKCWKVLSLGKFCLRSSFFSSCQMQRSGWNFEHSVGLLPCTRRSQYEELLHNRVESSIHWIEMHSCIIFLHLVASRDFFFQNICCHPKITRLLRQLLESVHLFLWFRVWPLTFLHRRHKRPWENCSFYPANFATFETVFDVQARDHSSSAESLADILPFFLLPGTSDPHPWTCLPQLFLQPFPLRIQLLSFNFFLNLHLPVLIKTAFSSCRFALHSLPLFHFLLPQKLFVQPALADLGCLHPGLGASSCLHHAKMRNLITSPWFSPTLPVCTSLAALSGCWSSIVGISTSATRWSRSTTYKSTPFFRLLWRLLPTPFPHAPVLLLCLPVITTRPTLHMRLTPI